MTRQTIIQPGGSETVPSAAVCPVCSGSQILRLFTVTTVTEYSAVRCKACNFVFTVPRPFPKELDEFYRGTYFRKTNAAALGYDDYRGCAEINARRMWSVLKDGYLRSHSPARLLDVGCATGGFLAEAAQDGWKCTGVEMSEEAAEIARQENGLEVFRGDISMDSLDDRRFDVITMWHVLEHVIHPMDVLRRAFELLAPGGLLFVELPNWNSIARLLKGPRWRQLKPPEHINYFTPASLAQALQRVGFCVTVATSAYPSFMDRASVTRWSQPFWISVAGIAMGLSKLGYGGYARVIGERRL